MCVRKRERQRGGTWTWERKKMELGGQRQSVVFREVSKRRGSEVSD